MAQDQLCKFCEDSEEPERGVLLICDLTDSGELPFAVGINCLLDWLTAMLEAITIPEGIEPSAPAELGEEDEEEAARDAQAALELTEKDFAARLAQPPIKEDRKSV